MDAPTDVVDSGYDVQKIDRSRMRISQFAGNPLLPKAASDRLSAGAGKLGSGRPVLFSVTGTGVWNGPLVPLGHCTVYCSTSDTSPIGARRSISESGRP
ncbi:hypothetical protein ACVWYO_000811 [Sphingomonas sp. UYP23]